MLRVERAQCFVVLLLVELNLRQAIACDLLELILIAAIDHPLQVSLGAGLVAAIELETRGDQYSARGIRRARVFADELSDPVPGFGEILALHGVADRRVEGGRLLRL